MAAHSMSTQGNSRSDQPDLFEDTLVESVLLNYIVIEDRSGGSVSELARILDFSLEKIERAVAALSVAGVVRTNTEGKVMLSPKPEQSGGKSSVGRNPGDGPAGRDH